MAKRYVFLLLLLGGQIFAAGCPAAGMDLQALGIRYGTNDGTDKKTDLSRYEVYGIFKLPWSWQPLANLVLETRLITSAGILDGEGDSGFIGTVSPGISLTDKDRRYSLELSAGVALLDDYRMGLEDYGGPLQFTLDAGIGIRLFEHFGAGYRFQHFSDAGLFGSDNRGVDMHMLELSYRFW